MFVKGLTWLVLLHLLGNAISALWLPALPGPIIGLALLLVWLICYGRLPESINQAATSLLQYMPLLLIIPAAGIMTSGSTFIAELPIILTALVGSLLITIPFCGWLMQKLIRRHQAKEKETS